ncbi:keratin-associated protein 27-1 [Nannospalax galili]|uniref:Keratin-associated protein n=1 Tax=Nannospalax galili TaxID=1026970 RepID=A0A8C6RBK1_NANGA|nr:keratin-associated protein 27-1 [Nannospalax galili]
MPHSHCHSRRSLGKAPPLSAILHDSRATSFEDGIFLPSSCYSRTWLLDNFEEACSETPTSQLPTCEQHQCTADTCVQWSCLPKVVHTTCSNSKSCEKTACQPAVPECASQSCQSRNNQQVGFVAQRDQTARYKAQCYLLKNTVSESCRTVESEYSQCHHQALESSSCSPLGSVAPGPQLMETSSIREPTCCVTGGLQLPSK